MRPTLFYRVCHICTARPVNRTAREPLCEVCADVKDEIESDTLMQKIARLFTDG